MFRTSMLIALSRTITSGVAAEAPTSEVSGEASQRYIIALRERAPAAVPRLAHSVADSYDLKVLNTYDTALGGFLAEVPESYVERVSRDPRVRFLERDMPVSMPASSFFSGSTIFNTSSGSHNLTYLDRLDEFSASTLDNRYSSCDVGAGVPLYILDIGVDFSHPEFAGRSTFVENGLTKWHQYWFYDDSAAGIYGRETPCSWAPDAWHGTAVASIAAGSNIGVAPAAEVVSLIIGDCLYRSSISAIIGALNWIISSNPATDTRLATTYRGLPVNPYLGQTAVLNWSGFQVSENDNYSGSPSLTQSLVDVKNAGVTIVTSADNYATNACGTGFKPNALSLQGVLLTVGATEINGTADERWREGDVPNVAESGSNSGECVSLWAVGASVLSARHSAHSDDYAYFSGTSFAAPVVAGVAASYIDDFRKRLGYDPTPDYLMNDLVTDSIKTDSSGQPLIKFTTTPDGYSSSAGMVFWEGGCRRRATLH